VFKTTVEHSFDPLGKICIRRYNMLTWKSHIVIYLMLIRSTFIDYVVCTFRFSWGWSLITDQVPLTVRCVFPRSYLVQPNRMPKIKRKKCPIYMTSLKRVVQNAWRGPIAIIWIIYIEFVLSSFYLLRVPNTIINWKQNIELLCSILSVLSLQMMGRKYYYFNFILI